MSMQDEIAKSLIKSKRKLFDYSVGINGTESKVIRFKIETDMYGDEQEIDIIAHDRVPMVLSFPAELPLDRLRKSVTEAEADTKNIYLYEIVPIEGFAPLEKNVEKGDILIRKVNVSDYEKPYLMVLQVAEVMGNVSNNHLVYKRFQCAPYKRPLSQQVQDIIDIYEDS